MSIYSCCCCMVCMLFSLKTMGFRIVVMWSGKSVSLVSLFFLFAEGIFLLRGQSLSYKKEKQNKNNQKQTKQKQKKNKKKKKRNNRERKKCRYVLLTLSVVSPFFVLFLRRHLIPQALQSDPLPKVDIST
jgi:hypothetical protein